MTLLAHAIAAAPPVSFGTDGLRGHRLAWSESGGLGIWSTDLEAEVKLARPDALEHHRLVERICAAQPCLPVRFGTVFPSADAARASLDRRAKALRASLARVAGKSELALTLLWREPPTLEAVEATGGPGRRYLAARRGAYLVRESRRARAESMVKRLVTQLAIERPLVWHETCTSESVAVSLAVLVPTELSLARKADLMTLASEFSDVTPVVNGPWPPYTFARTD